MPGYAQKRHLHALRVAYGVPLHSDLHADRQGPADKEWRKYLAFCYPPRMPRKPPAQLDREIAQALSTRQAGNTMKLSNAQRKALSTIVRHGQAFYVAGHRVYGRGGHMTYVPSAVETPSGTLVKATVIALLKRGMLERVGDRYFPTIAAHTVLGDAGDA